MGFHRFYIPPQIFGGVDIIIVIMKRQLHFDRQGQKIPACAVAAFDESIQIVIGQCFHLSVIMGGFRVSIPQL